MKKSIVIGWADVNDGFRGDKTTAVIVYDPANLKTYQVYPWGWCNLHPLSCIDEIEAEWIAKNHPENKNRVQFI